MKPLEMHADLRTRDFCEVLKEGGLVGCGGAGFPTWPKYGERHPYHLTNAQESEPGYYIDKWLHKAHAEAFAELYAWLLEWGSKKVIIGAKQKDREWFRLLEELTGGAVVDCTGRNRLVPDDVEAPIVFGYTDDRYAFGKEGALLMICGGVKVGAGERPGDHGFIVNNSQTLFHMHRLLTTGRPQTTKHVHVYGDTPRHVFVEAPVGTPADDLLKAAGSSLEELAARGHVLVEGGPGWFDRVDDPAGFSLTKRTNALLVIDPAYADPTGKDVLEKPNRPGYPKHPQEEHEKEPSATLQPSRVRVRLVDNAAFEPVRPARPVVSEGQLVREGEVLAEAGEGFSVHQHASIAGTVTRVSEGFVEVSR